MAYVTRMGRPIFSKNTARIIVQSKVFEFMHLTGPQQSEVGLDVIWDDYLRNRKIVIDTSKHIIRTKKMICSIYDPIEVLTQCYRRDVVLRIWIVSVNSKTSTTPSLKNRMMNLNDERALLSEDSAGEPEDSQDEEEVDKEDPNGIFYFRRQPLPPVLLPQESEPIQNVHRTIPTLRDEGLLATPRRISGRASKIPARFVDDRSAMKPVKRPATRENKSSCFNIPSPPCSPAHNSLTIKSYKSSYKFPSNSRSALYRKRRNRELLAKLPPHVKKVLVTDNGSMAGSAAVGSAPAAVGSAPAAVGSATAAVGSAPAAVGSASAAIGSASKPTKPLSGVIPGKGYRGIPELPLKPAATSERMEVDNMHMHVPTESEHSGTMANGTSLLTGGASSPLKRVPPKSTIRVKLPMNQGSCISKTAPVETPGAYLAIRGAVPVPSHPTSSFVPKTSPMQIGATFPMKTRHAAPAIPGTSSSGLSGQKFQFVRNEDEDGDDEEDLANKFKLMVVSYWNHLNAGEYREMQNELHSLSRNEIKWYAVLKAMPRTFINLVTSLKIYG